jgi:hypothetical protein
VQGNDLSDITGLGTGNVGNASTDYIFVDNIGYAATGVTFPDGGTTPSVANQDERIYICSNTGATVYTDFLNATDGQRIYIVCDANATINNGAPIANRSGANDTPGAGIMKGYISVAGVWREIS